MSHVGLEWVMQGWSRSRWDGVGQGGGGLGDTGARWVMQE